MPYATPSGLYATVYVEQTRAPFVNSARVSLMLHRTIFFDYVVLYMIPNPVPALTTALARTVTIPMKMNIFPDTRIKYHTDTIWFMMSSLDGTNFQHRYPKTGQVSLAIAGPPIGRCYPHQASEL